MKKPLFLSKAKKYCYSLTFPNLPHQFDGFKIGHISDLHSNPAPGIAEIFSSEKPDICVITGDLLHHNNLPYEGAQNLIYELLKISPVYFISGNHDVWREGIDDIFGEFTRMGAVFLDGKIEKIEKNGEKIHLFGVADPASRHLKVIDENLKKSLDLLPYCDGFNILLIHRANLYDKVKNLGYDLILSGHMHGGQIRVPYFGGLLAPTSSIFSKTRMIFPKFSGGLYRHPCTMVVNHGASNTLPIPRFGNPPDAGIITLLKGN